MDKDFQLKPSTYEWTVRLFHHFKKLLGINIKLHGDTALLEQGEIFLFNHFARTETFLPHYVIHRETGAMCRCIATRSIFTGSRAFRNYLAQVGVIPNNHENLLPILVADIIRGRKVIIYPEGGMVKDRRVVDHKGRYSVYSAKAGAFRKHHVGAAVLAIALDTFKLAVQTAEKDRDWKRIDVWVDMLGLKNRESLLFAVHRPTRIIPGNITFYPISTGDNFLCRAVGLLNNDLSPSVREEILIESNLLLRDTDMDIRLGQPVCLSECRPWWERKLMSSLADNLNLIEDFFTLDKVHNPLWQNLARNYVRYRSGRIRDEYMAEIYRGLTINLSHLAATLVIQLVGQGRDSIEMTRFCLTLYLALKQLQSEPDVNLHRSLRNTEDYAGLACGDHAAIDDLLETSRLQGLLKVDDNMIVLLERLRREYEFETVRVDNTLQVYANEAAPNATVKAAIVQAMNEIDGHGSISRLADLLYDDEIRRYEWCHHYYSKSRFDNLNRNDTVMESGRPFLSLPENARRTGILLVHGFRSSPAEMKPIAGKLLAEGYPVYAVRITGHGTSAADLRERSWQEWLESVRRGYKILSFHADNICMLGFSTGGVLGLIQAATRPDNLLATIVINPPLKFRNKNMLFVPLLHNVSKVTRWTGALEGVVPYRINEPEHPRINYSNVPVRGLYELMKMKDRLLQQAHKVHCPCLLIQSSHDPVVMPDSINSLVSGLVNANVTCHVIDSDRHGILYELAGDIDRIIIDYLESMPQAGATGVTSAVATG